MRPNVFYYEGKLHAMLVTKLPERFVRVGRVQPGALAEAIGYDKFSVRRWMRNDKLSPGGAQALMAIRGATITKDDVIPFILD